jgi:RNA polymerase sigma factor (sigma-70 family)
MDMLTDEALARLAIAGDRAALEELARRLLDLCYRLALRCLANDAEAEDAAQEIVTSAVTHLSQFEFRSALKTWVISQALRTLARWSRRHGPVQAMTHEELAERIDLGLSLTTAASLPEGDVHVLAREVQLGCTQGMLAALTDAERLAYVTGAILGANDEEGAELLGITPEAFRQRLSRARARMQPLLERRCGLSGGPGACSCARQATAKQRAGQLKLRFVERVALQAANEELGGMIQLGKVFRESPPLGAPGSLWEKLRASFPRLTGKAT